MKAYILSIGDEILIGQILNTNANWMATALNNVGIQVAQIISLADDEQAILETVELAMSKADVILITGGLGPTKDDITKKTLADYFGMELSYHEASFENIARLFAEYGRKRPDDRYKMQSYMPQGAKILINKVGTASGMWFEQQGKVVVSMPGVPREMRYLMQEEVLPRLEKQFALPAISHRTLISFGKGETDLSTMLEEVESALPRHIKLAYLPNTSTGYIRLRLSARGNEAGELQLELDQYVEQIKATLGYLIIGEEAERLEHVVGRYLKEQQLTLATAESCTGGNIAHKITGVAGCSAYYMGSVVAYSNDSKIQLLGVNPSTLATNGAVSEAVVCEMALGILHQMNVDFSIATSGIAGPGGGSTQKPVGTIWVAVGHNGKVYSKCLQLGNNRERNIELTSNVVLSMLLGQLKERALSIT